jgi:hypothetical protein
LILLEAPVNGNGAYRFVFDTGAGLTMISPGLAQKLDVRRDEAQTAVGAGRGDWQSSRRAGSPT